MMTSARCCTARRKDGNPCRAWAVRGSDPPRCTAHRHLEAAAQAEATPAVLVLGHAARAKSRRAFAAEQVAQPRPDAEAERDPDGFYRLAYSVREMTDLVQSAAKGDLHDELSAARVAVRRVLQQLREELSPAEYARMASLIFRGTSTIAGLMRAQRHLSREASAEWAATLSKALDEVGRDKGVDL